MLALGEDPSYFGQAQVTFTINNFNQLSKDDFRFIFLNFYKVNARWVSEDTVVGVQRSSADAAQGEEPQFDLELVDTSTIFYNNRINCFDLYDQLRKMDGEANSADLRVRLQIQYQFPYSKSREGLNLYVDQASTGEKWYIYSQLIFHCWAVIPCFDQPDLKAVLKLVVLTKESWVAVSNAPEKKVFLYDPNAGDDGSDPDITEKEELLAKYDATWMLDHFLAEDRIKVVEFEETEPLPTYLYTINAGEYSVFEHQSLYPDSPPQRVFQRKGSSAKMDLRQITILVEKTIKFYENELFGMKFPFRKLDHVLCPDVRYAAMESAGCITYSELALTSKASAQMANSERINYHMVV